VDRFRKGHAHGLVEKGSQGRRIGGPQSRVEIGPGGKKDVETGKIVVSGPGEKVHVEAVKAHGVIGFHKTCQAPGQMA